MINTQQTPTVVIGFFGTVLDKRGDARRWKRWRPTVSLMQHDDLLIDRLELLHPPGADVAQLLEDIALTSPQTKVRLHEFVVEDFWDFEQMYGALHDFARSYAFEPERERYLVHLTTGTHVAQICLFLLTETQFLPAQLLQSAPPRGRGSGPNYSVIDLDLARYDRIAGRFEAERRQRAGWLKAGIATKNEAFNALMDQVERVGGVSREPILLSGATGTGKTQLARRIYELKKTRGLVSGPLVEVNCATLRGDQAMSTLFGHRRGAFTGAVADRQGLLAGAHRGVLFLDEIGELGLDEQAMLLTAIEDKRFFPVGSETPVDSDFQLIAGTNRDLREGVAHGRFRDDLLARVDLWHFTLPPLAQRREDIAPNLEFELERVARRTDRRVTFNVEARKRFLRFATSPQAAWKNNFRDLGAAITRMSTLAPTGRIRVAEVETEIQRLQRAWGGPAADGDGLVEAVLGEERAAALDLFDLAQLEAVLRTCQRSASLSAAGRALFAQSRLRKRSSNDADRLRKYLARFGLDWAAVNRVSGL